MNAKPNRCGPGLPGLPLHLLEPAKFPKDLQQRQVLEILTDHDGALDDIPTWCASPLHARQVFTNTYCIYD
jgi:TusA-related sulfurtransferase